MMAGLPKNRKALDKAFLKRDGLSLLSPSTNRRAHLDQDTNPLKGGETGGNNIAREVVGWWSKQISCGQ